MSKLSVNIKWVSVILLLCSMPEGFSMKNVPHVSNLNTKNYFSLVSNGVATPVYVDKADYSVVGIAANLFTEDIQKITDKKPLLLNQFANQQSQIVIIGTIGKSELINQLIKSKKLNAETIRNQWESYIISTVLNPFPGVQQALVIAGSDRRGTAYGVLSLSEAMGVSPWYWWADVTPQKKNNLFVQNGTFIQNSPSVKYRGFFINDERFGGFAIWAAKTFDPMLGNVGPKTYQKVFELLLRLKGNYLWPAMHPGTRAFNHFPENAKLADDYAIVMGSSHCEQMLRNNEDEWKAVGTYGDFNYGTNRQTMLKYWEKRVEINGKYENTYTLGIRGIHDYAMDGAKTITEQVAYTQLALDDQRNLLTKYVDNDISQVPQVLCAYKEVLSVYQNGLKLPTDVTLLWADDNHGFIRQLSNPEEQKRAGGSGVYYHLAYHGDPDSWIWLSTISPSLVAYEMTKAYEYGADKIWIFNVGDIKPAEKELTFAMEMAWDSKKWKPQNAHLFIESWSAKTFGKETSREIAEIMKEYYRLAALGKEPHVRWIDFSETEIAERIEAYQNIRKRADVLKEKIPRNLQNAYFQLILYPVTGAGLMNEYYLLARRSLVRASRGENDAMNDVAASKLAYNQLDTLTEKYNLEISNGKWNHFWNWRPYGNQPSTTFDIEIATPELIENGKAKQLLLPVEEAKNSYSFEWDGDAAAKIPVWIQSTTPIKNQSFAAADNIFCTLKVNEKQIEGAALPIGNIWHATDIGPLWNKMGEFDITKGKNLITITDVKTNSRIHAVFVGFQPPFVVEPHLKIKASDFIKKRSRKNAKINIIQGLGGENAISILPFTAPIISEANIKQAPWVEYNVVLQKGDNRIDIHTLPTQRIYNGRNVRFAVSVNNLPVHIFNIQADEFSAEWQKNVLRGYALKTLNFSAQNTDNYRVRVYIPDAGVAITGISIQQ